MQDITETFFSDIIKEKNNQSLHNISGSILFDIDGKTWRVDIAAGKARVSKNVSEADCICSVNKQDFEHMVIGKQNPFTLLLQMKITCSGSLELAQVFQRLFPDKNIVKTL